jgi:hypothetical protein
MKTRLLIMSIVGICIIAAPALAGPTPGGPPYKLPYDTSLQKVLDDITVGGNSSVNVETDFIADTLDTYWDITATGGSVATVIIELASFENDNTFGVYDSANHMTKVQIFDGAATTGSQATLSITGTGMVYLNHSYTGIDFAGENFGYYVDSSFHAPAGGVMYSDTSKNADGYDHMYAYQGTGDEVKIEPWDAGEWTNNEYVLAFEDLNASWEEEVEVADAQGNITLETQTFYSDWDYTDFVVMVESVKPIPVPGAILLGILGMSVAGIKLRKHA